MAGVLPYLGTSLTTLYLAYDINHDINFIISEKTAELLLQIIEPIQIGYGAVVGPLFRYNVWSNMFRSSPSSEPSTGASNGLNMVVNKATHATHTVLSLPPSPGLRSCFLLNMR